MSTFVLIHGAGDAGWSWHLVEAGLRARGHDTVAPDLPCDDDTAGLQAYVDTVVGAVGDRRGLVVVGHSLGGFTAPLVADRLATDLLVLVAGMIPAPGETGEQWWRTSGYAAATDDDESDDALDPYETFFHDVPRELADEAVRRERAQSMTPLREPWPLDAWPRVPTRFVLGLRDRLFPAAFLRRLAAERLGVTADELDAGHCVTLSRPRELAALLHGYADATLTIRG